MTILPPDSAEQALSHLLMSPTIAPDDHIPVTPAPSAEYNDNGDESDSDIDDIEGTNSNICRVF